MGYWVILPDNGLTIHGVSLLGGAWEPEAIPLTGRNAFRTLERRTDALRV